MPSPIPEIDYEATLSACADGDRGAMRQLYEIEGPRMLGVALRIVRQRALAEDIVHDACVNIWSRAATFDLRRGSGRGWIYSIVRHLALNAVRSSSRHVAVDEETQHVLEADLSMQAFQEASPPFEHTVDLGRLQHCLNALEPARRHCVIHAYVEGCSHQEIAQRVGAPLGTVKAWIRRSLISLRECLA